MNSGLERKALLAIGQLKGRVRQLEYERTEPIAVVGIFIRRFRRAPMRCVVELVALNLKRRSLRRSVASLWRACSWSGLGLSVGPFP